MRGLTKTNVEAAIIRPVVRLEFGCRGDVWPGEDRDVRPYVAETFPALFGKAPCSVHVLRPDRTFWEKVTLLHAVTHSGKTPPRLSRHYYDVSRLYRHEVGRRAISDFDLLEKVVKHKNVVFREAAARYDLAKPGSLRISPGPELEREPLLAPNSSANFAAIIGRCRKCSLARHHLLMRFLPMFAKSRIASIRQGSDTYEWHPR